MIGFSSGKGWYEFLISASSKVFDTMFSVEMGHWKIKFWSYWGWQEVWRLLASVCSHFTVSWFGIFFCWEIHKIGSRRLSPKYNYFMPRDRLLHIPWMVWGDIVLLATIELVKNNSSIVCENFPWKAIQKMKALRKFCFFVLAKHLDSSGRILTIDKPTKKAKNFFQTHACFVR